MPTPLKKLTIIHFRHVLERPIETIMGPVEYRPTVLLRIEDAEGAWGWGEIWCSFPPGGDSYRAELAAQVLPSVLATLNSEAPASAFDEICARLHNLSIQAGEPGPLAQLAAGADIALHDLAARRVGRPLAEYLGGAVHDVDAYASGISPNTFEAQFERMRALGFRRFKQRVGFGADDSLGEVEAAARDLRHNERQMIDANQAWDLETAIARVDRLAPLDLAWLEEPLPADTSLSDWKTLSERSTIPLAGGENLRRQDDFDAAIELGALSVVQPDICKWGGLSGGLRVATRAREAGRTYCPHFLGGGVGLMASAHLLAAVGGDGVLEVDSSENPLLEILSAGGLTLRGGKFPVPDAPGLGYEPDVASASSMQIRKIERNIELN